MPVTSGLREKLLGAAAGAAAGSDDNASPRRKKAAKKPREQHEHRQPARPKMTEEEIVRLWQSKPPESHFNEHLRRKFLIRLATSLHSYGSSASRTEYLTEKAAARLEVDAEIAVFPSLICLSFDNDSHQRAGEVHLLKVESGYDADKLGRADQLANNAGLPDSPLVLAYWRLKAIANATPEFGRLHWRLLGFSVSAACAALLLFEGSLWDACLALVLGLVVGLLDSLQPQSSLFANVFKFVSSLVVSFLARLLSVYITSRRICYYALALGSLCRVLPGLTLTLGVSDLVASAQVTGSSRIISALFSSLQIGFGLAIGDDIIFWVRKPTETVCGASNLAPYWRLVWFLGYALSLNILLHSRVNQWPGMTLAAFVGWVAKTLASTHLGNSASTIIAAFAIGVTGTSYSYFTGDLPLVMLFSGILLLVPGGIGIRAVTALLEDDVMAGMGFVFDMTVVALAITLGLLMAKLVLPSGFLAPLKLPTTNLNTIAQQFDDDESEEDMAL